MTRSIGLWCVVLTAGFSLSDASAEFLVESDVFVGGQEGPQGTPHYRIPGMAVAPDGSILAFAEGRRSNADPGQGGFPIDMVMKRSTDGGATWSPLAVLQSNSAFDFDDPAPVVDHQTGMVHLIHAGTPDNCGLFCVPAGVATNSMSVYQLTSADNGQTWSAPVNITSQVKTASQRGIVPGPGGGIQLQWQTDPSRNGRLVIPAHIEATDNFVFYSDDHGASWSAGGFAVGPNGNENEVVELTNGNLMMNSRQSGGSFRRTFLSTDGGSTWVAYAPGDVSMTTVDSSLIRFSAVRSGADRDRLLFSAPLGPGRTDMAVWTSYDEGQSFINPVQVDQGHGAYSVLQRLQDGSAGVLFEATGNTLIEFKRFDAAHLEGAVHDASLSHYDGFGNAVDPFRGGVGWSGAWNNTRGVVAPGALEFPGFFTANDEQHLYLRDASVTRDLGTGGIDLNANQDYYVSLFVRHSDADGEDAGSEFLDILFQDNRGAVQAAFGVGSAENFFVNNLGGTVSAGPDSLARDASYLVLAKIAAQDDVQAGNFDQISLAWYNDPEQVPTDESQVQWQLVGGTTQNRASHIDQLTLSTGPDADWLIDGLRMATTYDGVIVDTRVVLAPVLGDLNGDRLIDLEDWLAFRLQMQSDTSGLSADARRRAGDFDASGLVDLRDFSQFVALFDAAHGSGAFAEFYAAPEPTSGVLAAALAVMVVAARSRPLL